jgi:AcrR family transcriptional regulator
VSKGRETKESILDDAMQIASRVGFDGLTIGTLATKTGMSKSGLFAHFNSKEQLQLQTLEHARQRFVDVVIRPTLGVTRGEKRVRALFERWLDWQADGLEGGCVFGTASVEYDDQPGAMHDAVVRQQRDWIEFIATVAGTAVSEGEFRADLDTHQFAFALQSLMFGYRHAARLLHDPAALDHTRTAFEQLLASSR